MKNKDDYDFIGLARTGCTLCRGLGSIEADPCRCALRAIARICIAKYRECAAGTDIFVSRLLDIGHVSGYKQPNRKRSEFCADLYLLAKRTLDETEVQVFKRRLKGADLPPGLSGVDRRAYFNDIYRAEEKVGKACLETVPYALYPTDEYFQNTTRARNIRPFPAREEPRYVPLRPPLAPKPRRVQKPVAQPKARFAEPQLPRTVTRVRPGDLADIGVYARREFKHGASHQAIARALNIAQVPGPNGGTWTERRVFNLILERGLADGRKAA
jgi:hypothetical protein